LLLFLNQRSNPEDGDCTNDGCAKLTKDASPSDAQQIEQPAAKGSAEETKHTVHDDAIATTFHQLASAEASQTSKKERNNNTHTLMFNWFDGAKISKIIGTAKNIA
jgi:hypothetical protein